MVDIPGDATTTATVTVGSTTNGTIEVANDHDWFRIQLTAGQELTVALNGVSMSDPFLKIYDSGSNLLYSNDDGGPGTDSLISFAATTAGTYYIDAAGYDGGETGTYQLVVSNYVRPGPGTLDQFATQLTNGYWEGEQRHFNVTQGGTITVNVSAISAAGQNLAHQALALWSDLTGITFTDVTSGGQITFADSEAGAATDSVTSGAIITSSHVNISTQWLTDYGTGINTYAFQAYIHEIGHALGLGHAGNYNDTANYPYDALYSNDGWPVSVMSYFAQNESSYFTNLGFTREFVVTPMLADDVAIGNLYGLSTITRTGNTTYGFNSTAGRPEFDASLTPTTLNLSYTVFDSGGNDTLDYSGFGQVQRIDLNAEAYSNVGGKTGNVSIARGTVIENAIGGSGADVILGNSVDNVLTGGSGSDRLTGGGGADLFRDTAAGLNGDTITDFSAQDKIVITDANPATFTASLSGTTLSYTGGSLTLSAVPPGHVVVSAASSGVSIGIVSAGALDDFNGDGRSDILWRNDDGALGDWLGTANGGFIISSLLLSVPTSWKVAGTGDFNGDGKTDILWRNDNGEMSDWLGNASGGFTPNNSNAATNVATSWRIVGTGDFNGDGRDDILWRNSDGTLGNWLGTANGGFSINNSLLTPVATRWQVVGTGDFNGDGKADVLWRSDSGELSNWLGTASGGLTPNNTNAFANVPLAWHVVGTGDFNGDGRDDILWRNDDGTLSDWLGTASGGFIPNNVNAVNSVPTSWHVAATADYNGDGRDDILWRNDNGQLSDWLGTASGGFTPNNANAATSVATSWHPQSPDSFFV